MIAPQDAYVSARRAWFTTQDAAADGLLRMLDQAMTDAEGKLGGLRGYDATPEGRQALARAADPVLRELDKALGGPRKFISNDRSEGERIYARSREAAFKLPAGADAQQEAEWERECRAAQQAAQCTESQLLALVGQGGPNGARELRAAFGQNPSRPMYSQATLDKAVAHWSQATFPNEWEQVRKLESRRSLMEWAVNQAEALIARHTGGLEHDKAQQLSGAA